MNPAFDLLLDLSEPGLEATLIERSVRHLMSRDALGTLVGEATVLLPDGTTLPNISLTPRWTFQATAAPIVEANAVVERTGDFGRHLLVLLGPAFVPNEPIGLLIEAFRLDPHFGVGIPRQCDSNTGDILKIADDLGDPEMRTLPRRVLTAVPEYYLLPEILTRCFLIRDLLLSNLPLLEEKHDTLAGAMQHYLCHIRRAGFRTIIVNQSVIPAIPSPNARKLFVSKADTRRLHSEHPDAGRAKAEYIEHSLHMHESLLARAYSSKQVERRSLLLDVRGVPNYMNGTAEAVLALCDALKEASNGWTISLLAEPAASEHHRLPDRYPAWRVLTKYGNHFFTAALRPSQPWHISTLMELHGMALLNFFAMLDTISWDILFEAPRGLAAFWDFMCQYADGLLYNSEYTRSHVVRRFPLAGSRPEYVFHHSFHPRDYAPAGPVNQEGDYMFVIGNTYDHKHLAPTVDILSSAFPFQRIKVLGLKNHSGSNVETFESGRMPDKEIETLFSQARLIVFPSFYEGFGLPVLKGLSYGRTVIARRSDLLIEIASNYRGPGRLLSFSTSAELVDKLGRVLHNCGVEEMPLGRGLANAQEPITWHDVAQGVLKFIELQARNFQGVEWLARERAIRQLNAFCS